MNKKITDRDAARRGVALVITVAVLTAMFLLAVPFAVFMRMQYRAGTQAVDMARARYGETGAVNHARYLLFAGTSQHETDEPVFPFDDKDVDTLWEFRTTLRTRLSAGASIPAGGAGPFQFQVDDALGLPNDGDPETVDGYVRVDDEWMAYSDIEDLATSDDLPEAGPNFPGGKLMVRSENRGLFGAAPLAHNAGALVSLFPQEQMWRLDVEDPQSKINVNTASWLLLKNLFDSLALPGQAAIDIYLGRYRNASGDPGYYPYQNVNDIKRHVSLSAADFDKVRPFLTVHSGYLDGQQAWAATGSLETDMGGGGTGNYTADLADGGADGIAPFSVVRFVWNDAGTDYEEYRTVLAKNASGLTVQVDFDLNVDNSITLDWDDHLAPMFKGASADTPCYVKVDNEWIKYEGVTKTPGVSLVLNNCTGGWFGTGPPVLHTAPTEVNGDVICWEGGAGLGIPLTGPLTPAPPAMSADIRVQNRHAININTVTNERVLTALMTNVENYDGATATTITKDTAGAVADKIAYYISGDTPIQTFFDGNEDWIDGSPGFGTPRAELNNVLTTVPVPGLTAKQRQLLVDNFSQDPADWPDRSTAPLRFNSGALVGIDSMSVVDDRAGTPVAQSPRSDGARMERTYGTLPPLQPLWQILRSQKDFEEANDVGGSTDVQTTPLLASLD
ncbi:MAG: hypothetical protein J7M08_05020, partial [Planctomycetes bacterium]|nr:hypothetical protein [Planctomycetota bacterium]